MTIPKFELEPVIRLYEANETDTYLEVGTSPDAPDWPNIRTTTAKSRDYYGKVDLTFSPEKARQFANAILHICDSVERLKKQGDIQ